MSASPDLWPSSPGPSRLPAAAPPTLPLVRAVTGDGLVESDGELLRLFTRHGDPAAFDKLVERHAAMVWRVCRQTLRRQQDAEDAFQATFLLLVKSARQIGASESAAGWLFRVAYRTSLRARKRLASRREEALALDPTAPSEAEFPDLSGRQTIATLAEELMELPMRYQTPLVMRYLEGQSRRAIAEATDVTVATVQGRLARGKQLLRRRLIRRGVSLAVAMSAVSAKPRAAAAAAPTQVVLQTTSNAVAITTGGSLAASAVVLTLLEQGTRAMLFASISKPMAVAAACGLAALVLAAPPVESNATVSDGVVLTAALDGDEAEAPTATLQLTADEPTSDGELEASAPGGETTEEALAKDAAPPSAPETLDEVQDASKLLSQVENFFEQSSKFRSMAMKVFEKYRTNVVAAIRDDSGPAPSWKEIQTHAKPTGMERLLYMNAEKSHATGVEAADRLEERIESLVAEIEQSGSDGSELEALAALAIRAKEVKESRGSISDSDVAFARAWKNIYTYAALGALSKELDGEGWGRSTVRVAAQLSEFQRKHGLEETGEFDEATWNQLFHTAKKNDEAPNKGEPEASAPGVAAANDPPQVTGTVQTTSESPAVTATLQQSDPSLDSPDLRFGDMALNGRKLTDAEQNELLRKQWAEAAKKDPPPVDGEPSFKELHTWHTYWENRYDALRQQAEEMRIHREEGEGTATEGDIRLVAADIFKARAEALRYERELKLRALKDGEPGASATGGDAAKDIDDSMQTGDPIEQQSHDLDESLRLFEESIGAANRILTVARSVEPAMAESLHAAAAKSIDKAKSHRSMATQLFTTLVGDAALKDQEALRAAERYSRSLEDTKQRMEVVVSAYNQRNKNTSAAAKPRVSTEPTTAPAPPDPLLEWKTLTLKSLMNPSGYGLSRDDAQWFMDEVMPNRHDSLRATIKINPYADATEVWEAWVDHNAADKEREVRVITAMIRNREADNTGRESLTAEPTPPSSATLQPSNPEPQRKGEPGASATGGEAASAPATGELRARTLTARQPATGFVSPPNRDQIVWGQSFTPLQPLDTNGRAGTYAAANQRYGHSVQQLQRRLNETLDPSPKLDVDGDYGPKTTAAVRRVQTKHGLKPTGFADEATLRAMGFLVPAPSSSATTSDWSQQAFAEPAAPAVPAANSIPAPKAPSAPTPPKTDDRIESLCSDVDKKLDEAEEALLELIAIARRAAEIRKSSLKLGTSRVAGLTQNAIKKLARERYTTVNERAGEARLLIKNATEDAVSADVYQSSTAPSELVKLLSHFDLPLKRFEMLTQYALEAHTSLQDAKAAPWLETFDPKMLKPLAPQAPPAPEPPKAEASPPPADEASQRAASMNHLKEIILALLTFNDAQKIFPSVVDGGLSWRVELLPLLGYEGLHHEFHHDEPWDSPHNITLLKKMPDVFRDPRSKLPIDSGKTNYVAAAGPGAFMAPNQSRHIEDIRDGTSRTIALIEVSDEHAVEWTRPIDFDTEAYADDPRRGIGSIGSSGILTSLVDGSSKLIGDDVSSEALRAMLLIDDEALAGGGKPSGGEAEFGGETLSPTDAAESLQKGWRLFFARDQRGAEEAFRQVLAAEPGNLSAVNGLGFAVLNQGRPEEAKPFFEQIVAETPDAPGPLNGLARCLEAEGDIDAAVAIWERLVAAEPDRLIDPVYSLARVYEERGEHEKAKPLKARIAAEQPNAEEYRELLKEQAKKASADRAGAESQVDDASSAEGAASNQYGPDSTMKQGQWRVFHEPSELDPEGWCVIAEVRDGEHLPILLPGDERPRPHLKRDGDRDKWSFRVIDPGHPEDGKRISGGGWAGEVVEVRGVRFNVSTLSNGPSPDIALVLIRGEQGRTADELAEDLPNHRVARRLLHESSQSNDSKELRSPDDNAELKQGLWRAFTEPSALNDVGWATLAELHVGEHVPVQVSHGEGAAPYLKFESIDDEALRFRLVDPGGAKDGKELKVKAITGSGRGTFIRDQSVGVSYLGPADNSDAVIVLLRADSLDSDGGLKSSRSAPPTLEGARRLLHSRSYDKLNEFVATPTATRAPGRVDYSDGKADGKKSLGGSGHLLRFELPEGALGVKAVRIHGSRYGAPEAPDEDFEVAFLSEDRSEILAVEHAPYGLFRRGPEAWTTVKFDKPVVDLPEKFWVAINFNPGRTKGVYFSYDTSTGGERSMTGTSQQQPDQHKPVEFGGDWMASIVLERE